MDHENNDITSVLEKYPGLLNGGVVESNVTALQLIAAFATAESFNEKRWSDYIKQDANYICRVNDVGNTAVHYAIYNGNIDLIEWISRYTDLNKQIISCLSEKEKTKYDAVDILTYLQRRVKNSFGTYLHLASKGGNLKSVQYVLDNMVHTKNDLAESAFTAASEGHRDCLKVLVKYGADISFPNNDNQTTIDVIFSNFSRPALFIKKLLDQQITCTKTGNKIDTVTLDFSILKPLSEDETQEMHVFSCLLSAANDQEKIVLLKHPITETFLQLKWAKVRPFFVTQIAIYTIFVFSLSAHVMLLVDNFNANNKVLKYVLIITALESFIHAFLQLVLTPGRKWAQYEIWMNLSCTTLSLIVAITAEDLNPAEYYRRTPTLILHATSIAVLLAWTELMLLIGRLPTLGYYAIMFTAVLQKVIKVLLTFLCLVIGFALSFSIQFHTLYQFRNPWLSFVKTFVMMMGEYEYSDLFNSVEADKPNFRLPATSRVIFGLFIILVSIVLMNLMVGLAVNDIQGLQQEGSAKRYVKQADFLGQFEKVATFIRNTKRIPKCTKELLKKQVQLNSDKHTFNLKSKLKKTIYQNFTNDYLDNVYTYAKTLDHVSDIKLEDLIENIKLLFKNKEKI